MLYHFLMEDLFHTYKNIMALRKHSRSVSNARVPSVNSVRTSRSKRSLKYSQEYTTTDSTCYIEGRS